MRIAGIVLTPNYSSIKDDAKAGAHPLDDGVLGGALITANGQQTFRFVIYDGKGNMRSLGETPLTSPKLSSSDLEILGINLGEEVSSLQAANAHVASRPANTAPIGDFRPIIGATRIAASGWMVRFASARERPFRPSPMSCGRARRSTSA